MVVALQSVLSLERGSSHPPAAAVGSWLRDQEQHLDTDLAMTPVGLEPTIPGSVGRCLIHWATGPYASVAVPHDS